MGLGRPCEIRVIVEQQCDRRLRGLHIRSLGHFRADLPDLRHREGVGTVGAEQAGVQLLLGERGLSPAEIAHRFGPVGEGFPCPQTHHTGQWHGVVRGPVDRAGLLFHHPPAPLAHGAVKIVVERLKVGVALPRIAVLLRRIRAHPILEKAQRVAVPCGDIKIFTHCEMVKVSDPAHVIMAHGGGAVLADHVKLKPVECHHLIRAEPPERQTMRRVGFGHGQVGRVDVVETVVVHRPERIPPRGVQRGGGAVALCQPAAKGMGCRITIRDHRVVAAVFIVDLPRGHMGVRAIAFGHQRGNRDAFLLIAFVAETVVPARPEFARTPFNIHGKHVGVAFQHPAWRGGGGGAQHNPQTGGPQNLDRAVQPRPVILAGLRF